MIYFTLFFEFFKIGMFCFGGGYAMIPLIEEAVLRYGWLTEGDFYNLIGVCESTPGPIAVNMATYIGSVQGGIGGSIAATLGVVTPSFIIILTVAAILNNMTKNKLFKSFMQGVKPVIAGLILSTGVLLFIKALGFADGGKFFVNTVPLSVFVILFVIHFIFTRLLKRKISSVMLIVISAVLGIGVSSLFETLRII